MSRFSAFKFKNASAKIPKREQWINDLRVGSPSSCGNHIKASCTLMAFNTSNTGGGTLSILPLDKCGRGMSSLPMLHAHSAMVTDMDFSPFDDYMLATCSSDSMIKLWDIPEGGLTESMSTPIVTLPKQAEVVQNVLFHPTAEGLLASSCDKTLHVWDVVRAQKSAAMRVHEDQIQGISWKTDGSIIATTAKDKKLRILDPRQNIVCAEVDSHKNNKDSKVCWLGNTDLVLSTGFNKMRQREVCVWDVRRFDNAVSSHCIDQSQGALMPLFDPDTNMLFLAGKGDTTIRLLEVVESSSDIKDVDIQQVAEPTKGIAMVPKRALDVMACEVSRLLQLTANAVLPIPYVVPRKSHREFYGELFPDTNGGEAAVTAAEWLEGSNQQVTKVSLDPSKRETIKKKTMSLLSSSSSSAIAPEQTGQAVSGQVDRDKPDKQSTGQQSVVESSGGMSEATGMLQASSLTENTSQEKQSRQGAVGGGDSDTKPAAAVKVKKFVAPSTSKFRHMVVTVMPKSMHMFNLHNLKNNMSGESDVFHANLRWGAVPLGGPGGMIAFVDMNKPGKLLRDLPSVQNGTTVMDFVWDPFNQSRLAVACDNAKIFVWDLPSDSWTEPLTEPALVLKGHREKVYFVKFNPQASDVMMSASYDLTVKIWDLSTGQETITLKGHTDQIFSGAWSPDGSKVATVCKDEKIRIYDPRSSAEPVKEGTGPQGSRGARIVWVCGGNFLLVTGFARMSQRTVSIYSVNDLSEELETLCLDTSPSTLVPYYDQDTSVLILTGKGDLSITSLQIITQPPYFLSLAPFQNVVPHQALSFLPKNVCNVKDVEFAKAMRLTQTAIEPVTFTVPRVKKEYFQDDIFPETSVMWESALTCQEWFAGKNGVQKKINLCPKDMKPLSSIPKVVCAPAKYSAEVELSYKTDEQKKEELLSAMTNKLATKNEPLPQDAFEGVDDDEWDD